MMVTSLVMADVTFPETPVVKRGKTVRVAEDTGDISITLRSGVMLDFGLGHIQYFNIDQCIALFFRNIISQFICSFIIIIPLNFLGA